MKSEILEISSANENETEIDIKKQRLSHNFKFSVPCNSQYNIYPSNLNTLQIQKRSECDDLVMVEIDDIEEDAKRDDGK